MRMRSLLLALGMGGICSVIHGASSPDPADARCEWLLGLHLSMMPAKDLPIVRVPVSCSLPTGEKPRMVYTLGFLESDDGKNYMVRSFSLQRTKTPHSTWAQYDPDSAKALPQFSTSEAATLWCDWLDDADGRRDLDSRLYYGRDAQAFTQCMVFAAALYERGDFVAAHLLHQRATQMSRRLYEGPATKDFDHDLSEDLARALFKGIEDDVRDLEHKRGDLLKRLDEVIRHFPNTTTSPKAATMAAALRAVIAQSAQQPKLPDAELAKLPVKERVAALIRQLPDQTGHQTFSPGACEIFADERGAGLGGGISYWTFGYAQRGGLVYAGGPAVTPAGKLVEIGVEAVPQLIEAIDDRRPTRASGGGIPAWQRSSVLDVGDCAIQILQRLSTRSFADDHLPSGSDAARASVKANVQAWWKEVQDGTEAESLDRKISVGGEREPNLAARLIKIDPERAVAAIERGMSKAEKPWDAKWLLTPLSTIDSDAARHLIFRQVTDGRFLGTRIQAAQLVWGAPSRADNTPLFSEEEQRRAREAILVEWRRYPPKERLEPFDGHELAKILGSMAMKNPALLEAVAADWEKHSPNIRAQLIETLEERTRDPAKLSPSLTGVALEKFLATRLEDVAFSTHARFERKGKLRCQGARVAEYAAAQLARLWPERYQFTWDASGDEMEKARLACLNVWRVSQKQPPLSMPPPALRSDQDPATVLRFVQGKGSLPLEGDWPKWLHSLESKTLAGEDLVSLLVAHAEQNTEDKQSIRLTAYRQSARSGFVVEVTSGRDLEPTANGSYRLDVIVDGKPLMSRSGGLELRLARKYDLQDYKEFSAKIAEALKSPDTTIFIQAVRLAQVPSW